MSDPLELDAVGQADLVRSGQISATELVTAAIQRIEKLDPQLNALVTERFERGLAESHAPADGPLAGVPMLLKDHLSASAGDPMWEGMQVLRDRRWIEPADSHVVSKHKGAGFVILGKTNLPELAVLTTTEPVANGPTRNPWDRSRSVGGSSGGSAAAVASRMVAVAHGTDAGGSIRVPASMCGIVGLKPSRGRVSLGPDHGDPWANGSWHAHVLTRTVRDTAAVLDATAGYMPGDPFTAPPPSRPFAEAVDREPGPLRIGVLRRAPIGSPDVHADVVAAVDAAAALLERLGHQMSESHPAALDAGDELPLDRYMGVLGSGVQWMIGRWARRTGAPIGKDDLEPYTWALAELGDVRAADLLIGLEQASALARGISAWWTEHDVLLTPTISTPPFALGALSDGVRSPIETLFRASAIMPFAGPFNLTGQPAISLPLHWSADGLPIGVQLVAAYGSDELLLSLSGQLERAQPWADRRPPEQRAMRGREHRRR